jgi:hypothetical protein
MPPDPLRHARRAGPRTHLVQRQEPLPGPLMRRTHRQRAKIVRPLAPPVMLNSQHQTNCDNTDTNCLIQRPYVGRPKALLKTIDQQTDCHNLRISNWTRFNDPYPNWDLLTTLLCGPLARLCAAPSTRRPSVAGLGVGGHEGRMTPPHPFTAFHRDEMQEKVTRWNNKGCGLDPASGEWRAVESPEGMVDGALQQVRQT